MLSQASFRDCEFCFLSLVPLILFLLHHLSPLIPSIPRLHPICNMTSSGEPSKKRTSFSLLSSWIDPATSSKPEMHDTEPANGRFIPESKRGWKYDPPYPQAASSSATAPSNPAKARRSHDAPSRPSPNATGLSPKNLDLSADAPESSATPPPDSAPETPKPKSNNLTGTALGLSSSESSFSDDEPEPSPPNSGQQISLHNAAPSVQLDGRRHPDDLVFPDAYPWKPSTRNPKAKFIHPAHRNPTAKQAFYDTHFGSSSNYRGLLPASGSLLNLTSAKAEAKRRSSTEKFDLPEATPDDPADVDAQSNFLVSTVKKPFATASKLLTKARRKSLGAVSFFGEGNTHNNTTQKDIQASRHRPPPVPLYNGNGDGFDAQRSGFSYGLSMEDAAQVEAVVSRHASSENVCTPVRLDQQLLPPASQEASPSRWREAMQSAWGFLPSFEFFASSNAPADDSKDLTMTPYANMLEPEAIPTVKKDAGCPDYFTNLSGNVVIMGGYRGSVLRDAETSMMMWIPIRVGVGLRRPTLELGLSTSAEEKSEELVYSSEMCTSIGKLVDMGKRLEERIAGRRHAKAYAWGYDWRLSLARSSRRLIQFLEELYEASADASTGKKRGAKVVAHSMGGLVALHALATCNNPRIFEGLVFASTPFRGTPNILGPFRFGDAALFNDTICSPRATFSFRSSFYLLPTDGRCFEVPVGDPEQDEEDLTEQQKKDRFKDVDFLDPDVWNELGLSPCLEIGRRQQMVALARKSHGARETRGLVSALKHDGNARLTAQESQVDRQDDYAEAVSSELDVARAQVEEHAKPNGLTMGVMEGLTDGSARVGGDSGAQLPADDEEQEALQPENRQGAQRNAPVADSSSDDSEFDKLDYATQSWVYLERTLDQVRRFWADIEQGFDESKFKDGVYPPLMILTSGRTPCVRGALVGFDTKYAQAHASAHASAPRTWKDDVRAGDYSRMAYGAGDGVITRRSATSLPGRWPLLLVKRSEAESLPPHLHAKPPAKPSTLKLDRYTIHLDGQAIVESAHRHVTLLSDVDAVGKCLEAIRRANLVRSS